MDGILDVDTHVEGVVEPVGELDAQQRGSSSCVFEQPSDVRVVGLARAAGEPVEPLHQVPFVLGVDAAEQRSESLL
ncbi:MAG: hypothetical protein MUF54_19065 [Polyangiaceae bacterium]|nr:hypothetical protein [Polyangiaceae bacterium]